MDGFAGCIENLTTDHTRSDKKIMKRRILLLHGAIGSADQLQPLADELKANEYDVRVFEFPGHGKRKLYGEKFSIESFAKDVMQWMDRNTMSQLEVFGYSMGGYVALYIAAKYPGYFTRITTLGTKFEWTPEIAARETKMLDAEKIELKVPAFANELEQRHAALGWKKVLELTADMMRSLGENNLLGEKEFSEISIPVTLLLGDGDKMVSREETEHAAKNIPGAKFEMLPATQHPIEKVDLLSLQTILLR